MLNNSQDRFEYPRNILVVIAGSFKELGGHYLSGLTLAKYIKRRGYNVGVLIANPLIQHIPEMDEVNFKIHHSPYPDGSWAYFSRPYWSRPVDIYRVVRKYGYDCLVAMDTPAAIQSGLAAILLGLPLVQVVAGRAVMHMPPLRLPGIVVFSQELFDGFQVQHGIPSEEIILSSGRVDFDYFSSISQSTEKSCSFGFTPLSPRILIASRLGKDKKEAVWALLEQVEEVARFQPVQLIVVGDGAGRESLEQFSLEIEKRTDGKARIQFLGSLRIQPSALRQADLFVGQGRGVIEAIASGVPAAVCGKDGYFGLLTPETLPVLARTNLTGRQIQERTSLLEDLRHLEYYQRDEFSRVRSMAYDRYDANLGAEAVERAFTIIRQSFPDKQIYRQQLIKAYKGDFWGWICHWSKKLVRRSIP